MGMRNVGQVPCPGWAALLALIQRTCLVLVVVVDSRRAVQTLEASEEVPEAVVQNLTAYGRVLLVGVLELCLAKVTEHLNLTSVLVQICEVLLDNCMTRLIEEMSGAVLVSCHVRITM